MPMAARLTDMTSHNPPLNPGLGNLDVLIGGLARLAGFAREPIARGCPTVFIGG